MTKSYLLIKHKGNKRDSSAKPSGDKVRTRDVKEIIKSLSKSISYKFVKAKTLLKLMHNKGKKVIKKIKKKNKKSKKKNHKRNNV